MRSRLVLCCAVLSALGSACAPDINPASTTSSPTPPQDGADPRIAMSIHVEGWQLEAGEQVQFQAHVAQLLELASTANDHGAVLTFELSPVFTQAVSTWHSDVLDQLVSLGHELAIHADVGGQGEPTLVEMVDQLQAQIARFEAATGQRTDHVSGICSRGPWVEAAVEAGFTSMAGGVEYCMTSLAPEHVPEGFEWVAGCASPSVCHGPVPVPVEQAAPGWWASSSDDWIVDRTTGDLLILTGPLEGGLACFTYDDGGPCPDQADDLATVETMVERYAATAASEGTTTVLPLTWSVGRVPAEGFAEALFSTVEDMVLAGTVDWIGLPSAARSLGA
jgi:hypothetical protein